MPTSSFAAASPRRRISRSRCGSSWRRSSAQTGSGRFACGRIRTCSSTIEGPMLELTRVYHFSAGHRLADPALSDEANEALYGACYRPHGHNYYLEVTVAGRPDPVTGMSVDLGRIDGAVHERVQKALRYFTSGYGQDIKEVLNGAMFVEEYDEMVIVKDIDFFSLCVPSKQIVNAVDGAKPARMVRPGDRLWTLDGGDLKETTVTLVASRKTREIVEIKTTGGAIRLTPDHPIMTDSGWREAADLEVGT